MAFRVVVADLSLGIEERPFTVKSRASRLATCLLVRLFRKPLHKLCRLDVRVNKEYAMWNTARAARVSSRRAGLRVQGDVSDF